MTVARVSRVAVEVLTQDPTPLARVSRLAVEVLQSTSGLVPVPATVTPTVTARTFTVPTALTDIGPTYIPPAAGDDENRMGGGAIRRHPTPR